MAATAAARLLYIVARSMGSSRWRPASANEDRRACHRRKLGACCRFALESPCLRRLRADASAGLIPVVAIDRMYVLMAARCSGSRLSARGDQSNLENPGWSI